MMFFSVLTVAVLGAQLTFFLIHKKHISTVRASSGPTFLFCLLISLGPATWVPLQAAFFGATFVGMTDKSRMGWKRVFIASLLFGLIYFFLIPLVNGFGGGLGAAAFVSCALIHALSKLLP